MIYDDGIVEGRVPYFKDGTRVELAPFDYGDGEGPVEVSGTVRHDLGGDNVPVYLDGKNTSGYPHDYTSVPRYTVTHSRFEVEGDPDDEGPSDED